MDKYLELKNCNVHYDLYNAEKQSTIVLVHGFGLSCDMWNEQINILSDYKIINIDARGHGKSRPCDKFDIVEVCHDIKSILEKENCDRAAIVGLSMGSYVTQEFARLYPESTSGIFVADGTPLFIKYPKWEILSLRWSGPLLKLYTWKSLKKVMAKQTSVKQDVREKLESMFGEQTKEEFISSWAGISNALHEEKVSINCPFYVVYGEKDSSGTIKLHAKDWKKEYPKCIVHEIPDAGHVSNMDNPEVFNKLLLDFLSSIENN